MLMPLHLLCDLGTFRDFGISRQVAATISPQNAKYPCLGTFCVWEYFVVQQHFTSDLGSCRSGLSFLDSLCFCYVRCCFIRMKWGEKQIEYKEMLVKSGMDWDRLGLNSTACTFCSPSD